MAVQWQWYDDNSLVSKPLWKYTLNKGELVGNKRKWHLLTAQEGKRLEEIAVVEGYGDRIPRKSASAEIWLYENNLEITKDQAAGTAHGIGEEIANQMNASE